MREVQARQSRSFAELENGIANRPLHLQHAECLTSDGRDGDRRINNNFDYARQRPLIPKSPCVLLRWSYRALHSAGCHCARPHS